MLYFEKWLQDLGYSDATIKGYVFAAKKIHGRTHSQILAADPKKIYSETRAHQSQRAGINKYIEYLTQIQEVNRK